MIPRTFPSTFAANGQQQMVVYVLPSITGLTAWIDYIPVKGVTTESATLENTYANGGYQVVDSLESLTGLQAWRDYIPVYEDASYNKPWSTDAGGYVPVGGLFSIPSLFVGGIPGVWYDPSDYGATGTLFQNSAGTTPVTAVEQPVGLMLDKSQGLVLGPELVTNGDFATDTGWAKEGGTTISGGVAVFNGTSGSSLIYRSAAVVIGKTYKITFTVTSRTSGTLTCRLFGGTSGFSATAPGTYVFYDTPTTINTNVGFYSSGGFVGTSDDISVKELPGNHAFQSTSASRPVLKIDGNGKYYLKFDGVDDSLSTNSISFTSTDKMSVFAGVRHMNTAATGVVFETSADAGANAGAMALYANTTSYSWRSGGSIRVTATASVTPPITNVATGLGDISGDLATLRLNGVQIATNTADQGTGNFGNYPLYIGRRNNASLPLNGQLYSLVIVGKAVTAGELTNTETYVATKTGVTL